MGSLPELSEGGTRPIVLSNGERRTLLLDGDAITLRGRCARRLPHHRLRRLQRDGAAGRAGLA